jgi:hypothetical protein
MNKPSPEIDLPATMTTAFLDAAAEMLTEKAQTARPARRGRGGETLRPGEETPLWNTLAAQIRPLLKGRGEQAKLARLLGQHRQSIHAYFGAHSRMPDAERTLQLLAWLIAKRQGQEPS